MSKTGCVNATITTCRHERYVDEGRRGHRDVDMCLSGMA